MRTYLVAVLFIVCGICSAQMLHSEFNYWWSVKSEGGPPPVENNLCFTDTDTSCGVNDEFNEVGTYNGSAIYQGVADLGLLRVIYWDDTWVGWVLNEFPLGFGPLDPGFVDGGFPIYFLGFNATDVLDYTEDMEIFCTLDFGFPTGRPLDPCGGGGGSCDFTLDIGAANCSEIAGDYFESGTFNGFPTYELSGGGYFIWFDTNLFQWWIGSSPGIQGPASGANNSADPSDGTWFCSIDIQPMTLSACGGGDPDFSIDATGTLCAGSINEGDYFEAGVFNGSPYYETSTGSFVWYNAAGSWIVSSTLGLTDPSQGMYAFGTGIDFCSEYGTLFCADDISPVTVVCGGGGGGVGDVCIAGLSAGLYGSGPDANGGYVDMGLNTGGLMGSNYYQLDGTPSGTWYLYRVISGEWVISQNLNGFFECLGDDWYSNDTTAGNPWEVVSWLPYCGAGTPVVTQGACP